MGINNRRCLLLGLVVALWPALLPARPNADVDVRYVHAADARPDACAGAATATNAVVRFYLAVDRRQFAAAYRCLAASMQVTLPYATFVAGYAHTVVSRLVLADDGVPNGSPVDHVTFELHAVDVVTGGLIASIFSGRWMVSSSARLIGASVRWIAQRRVSAIPSTDATAVFSATARVVLAHLRAAVTGDGVADDVYITSGAGCGSCHAQQVWVYSQNRLVFQQQVDDAAVIAARDHAGMEIRTDTPGSPGLDSCCPTSRTYEQWVWTPYGFALRGSRVVKAR